MDQVRRLLHERSEPAHAIRCFQIESDATMDASLTEVAEEIRFVFVLGVKGVEIAEITTKLLRRHRRVIPSGHIGRS
jgi:hypothetical protein